MAMNAQNKQALVTGGAGAIGINLVSRLIKEGFNVTVFSLPAPDLFRLKNIGKKVEIVTGDITHGEQVKAVISRLKPHYVFHLASTTMAVTPVKHIEVNAIGTINLLEALRETGVDRFIYTGSASVRSVAAKMGRTAFLAPPKPRQVSLSKPTRACIKYRPWNCDSFCPMARGNTQTALFPTSFSRLFLVKSCR